MKSKSGIRWIDADGVEKDLDAELAETSSDIAGLRSEVNTSLSEFQSSVDTSLSSLQSSVNTSLGNMQAQLDAVAKKLVVAKVTSGASGNVSIDVREEGLYIFRIWDPQRSAEVTTHLFKKGFTYMTEFFSSKSDYGWSLRKYFVHLESWYEGSELLNKATVWWTWGLDDNQFEEATQATITCYFIPIEE